VVINYQAIMYLASDDLGKHIECESVDPRRGIDGSLCGRKDFVIASRRHDPECDPLDRGVHMQKNRDRRIGELGDHGFF
jgi:hypothetical protein